MNVRVENILQWKLIVVQDHAPTPWLWRDYKILDAIEQDENVSQRDLASSVGIALGMTNQIVKRLIRKGLVKTQRINAKRVAYYLTPRGFSEKLDLVMRYTERTISFFSAVREVVRQRLGELKRERDIKSVAIVGTGELAEAVYLSLQELGLTLTAVYDGPDAGKEWFGQTIRKVGHKPAEKADVVVVAAIDHEGEVEAIQEISPIVVEMRTLLSNRLASFARRIVEEETEASVSD